MTSRQTASRETIHTMTSDWEEKLRKSAAAHKRAKSNLKKARDTLDHDMATAANNGMSLRDIKAIADLNHETIRTAVTRINGTAPEQPAAD